MVWKRCMVKPNLQVVVGAALQRFCFIDKHIVKTDMLWRNKMQCLSITAVEYEVTPFLQTTTEIADHIAMTNGQ